jgi:hypothetical protein
MQHRPLWRAARARQIFRVRQYSSLFAESELIGEPLHSSKARRKVMRDQ